MSLPANVSTGLVTGRFLVGVTDGPDQDQDPDGIAATGTVTFTAAVPYLADPTASTVILNTKVVGVLDVEGYLCTPVQGTLDPAYRGVRLIATDDPDVSTTGWTWNVSYQFGKVNKETLTIPGHGLAVLSNGTVDLSAAVTVPSSPGLGTEQAEALTASAQAAAATSADEAAAAAVSASTAAAAAQSTDANVAGLVTGPGQTRNAVDNITAAAVAPKLNSDDAASTYQTITGLPASIAAQVSTNGTSTNAAVKTIADASAAPKLNKDEASILAPAPDGVDDTAALQAALNAASTSPTTRRVHGRTGTYIVSNITIPADVTLANIKLKHKANSSFAAVTVSGVNAKLDRVELDGNAANQTNTTLIGFEVTGSRASVSDCYVHHIKWDGVVIVGTSLYVNVSNNRVIETGRYGITINSGSHIVIHGNTVERSANGGLGIIGTAEYVTFSSNTIWASGGDGIAAYNAANRYITAVGNTMRDTANHGIHLGGNGLVIADNAAYNVLNGHGYFVRNHDTTMLTGAAISGNVAVGVAPGSGLRAEFGTEIAINGNSVTGAAGDGVTVRDAQGVTVGGNTINSSAQGIQLNRTQHVSVTGNTLRNLTGYAILGQDLGGAATTHVNVTGNVISGCTDAIKTVQLSDYWLFSSNTVSGNTGSELAIVGANNKVFTPPTVSGPLQHAPTGALGTTIDRRTIAASAIGSPASGTIRLSAVWLPKGTVVSNITYLSGGSAAGLTNRWFALFDASRNKLRTTADNAATWAAGATLTLALSTAYTIPSDGLYYIGLCEVATTTTSLRGIITSTNGLSIAPILNGDSNTGLTNAASTPATAAALSVNGGIPYAYIS